MMAVADTLGVARSNLAIRAKAHAPRRRGQPPALEADLVAEIRAVIAGMPSYGYRRVWAVLRRIAEAEGRPPPNHKRVYRVKAHGMLLERHAGGAERHHDGRIAVDRSNQLALALRQGGRAGAADHADREPQSNGMAEAFKRDYVRVHPCPNAEAVIAALPKWFEDYNTLHPHKALGYCSPRELIAARSTP